MDLNECLRQGYLKKIKPAEDLAKKEFAEADYDLEKAKNAFKDKDYKWSIIMAYYSIFHSARAILFKIGYREKRHFAIGVVLDSLSKNGKLESKYVDYFNAAEDSRENADYHYVHSEEIAEHNIRISTEFIKKMKELQFT